MFFLTINVDLWAKDGLEERALEAQRAAPLTSSGDEAGGFVSSGKLKASRAGSWQALTGLTNNIN